MRAGRALHAEGLAAGPTALLVFKAEETTCRLLGSSVPNWVPPNSEQNTLVLETGFILFLKSRPLS